MARIERVARRGRGSGSSGRPTTRPNERPAARDNDSIHKGLDMMSDSSAKLRLLAVLSDAQPPDNPIVVNGWAGIAFDRNRYADLAPTDVWDAWLDVHIRNSCPSDAIGIASLEDLAVGKEECRVEPSLDSLRRYWMEGERFLRDHYVFSLSFNWVVRLDQDVTLFAAERDFMREVIDRLHGLNSVMERMTEDFDPGERDLVGLRRFLSDITEELRR